MIQNARKFIRGKPEQELPDIQSVAGWNYMAHGIEGGLYIGGMAFVDVDSILPRLTELLNGPSWIIGLTPMLLMLGFALPTMFTAHIIEQLHQVKPLLMITGIFQRIPYLFSFFILWYCENPALLLATVVMTPIISGLSGGISVTAWMELVAKTVPRNRRASVFAVRNTISAIIGMLAGGIVAWILGSVAGIRGYAVLHLITFVFLAFSYVFFALIRETDQRPRKQEKKPTLVQNLREMPLIVRRDRHFRRYLIARAMMNSMFIMLPFLAIHSLRSTGKPDAFLGALVAAQMTGSIFGNIIGGLIGDRYGGKLPMLIGRFVLIGACVPAIWTTSPVMFAVVFFCVGLSRLSVKIGTQVMSLEMCPYEKRSTYLAMVSFVNVPAMFLASFVSSQLWTITGNFGILVLCAGVLLFISSVIVMTIPEPRKLA